MGKPMEMSAAILLLEWVMLTVMVTLIFWLVHLIIIVKQVEFT